MFADHASSLNPIDVPRAWIWNLPRRTVYFGTSVSTIFKGISSLKYKGWVVFISKGSIKKIIFLKIQINIIFVSIISYIIYYECNEQTSSCISFSFPYILSLELTMKIGSVRADYPRNSTVLLERYVELKNNLCLLQKHIMLEHIIYLLTIHCETYAGFVCVRGFDQKMRAPRPLMARLHFPASKLVANKTKKEDK